ncbi:hypothetical protein OIU78_001214 [Salix suchowensis]|nr:hypothetical protein OIU78_001214 [Salix suchowensis]
MLWHNIITVKKLFRRLMSFSMHAGPVKGGLRLPESITGGDGIFPDQEHNACLLDHLGEVRPSDKLMGQHENMRCKINEQMWNALIGVCRIHGNMNFGNNF